MDDVSIDYLEGNPEKWQWKMLAVNMLTSQGRLEETYFGPALDRAACMQVHTKPMLLHSHP